MSNRKLDVALDQGQKRRREVPQDFKILLLPILIPFVCLYVSGQYLWSQCTRRLIPGFCGNGYASAKREDANKKLAQREAKELRKEAPTPLPAVRNRSLTLPLARARTRLWRRKRETADQLQSSLFGRFPLEVRELIYKYYLIPDRRCVHIFRRTDRRLGHYLCTGGHGSHFHMPLRPWGYDQISSTRAWQKDQRIQPSFSSNLLPLMKTCRRA